MLSGQDVLRLVFRVKELRDADRWTTTNTTGESSFTPKLTLRPFPNASLICRRCEAFEDILISNMSNSHRPLAARGDDDAATIHHNFQDLQLSAGAGCLTCRIWRKALMSSCYTQLRITSLLSSREAVIARHEISHRRFSLECAGSRASVELGLGNAKKKMGLLYRPSTSRRGRQVVAWQEECSRSHDCLRVLGSAPPPKRLLAVEHDGVRLIRMDRNARRVEYVALSYCWGGYRGLRLSNANMRSFEQGIQSSTLPRTIRHAARLTRDVRIRHLWVDALCILQTDDGSEWREEVPRMHHIYGHATFTLSVCFSENADAGFLDTRSGDDLTINVSAARIAGSIVRAQPQSLDAVRRHCSLASRGWVFQEELLSPRVLYWSNQGLFWSCLRGQNSETGAATTTPGLQPQAFWTHERPVMLWSAMVEDFSRRDFTQHNDRLLALAGLTEIIRQKSGDECLCGLWRSQIPASLCWTAPDSTIPPSVEHPPIRPLAPSWSWASIPPPRSISMASGSKVAQARLTAYRPEGTLCIRGRFRALTLDMYQTRWPDHWEERAEQHYPSMRLVDSSFALRGRRIVVSRDWHFQFDVILDYDVALEVEGLYCLRITDDSFLLLSEMQPRSVAAGTERRFKRIGCARGINDRQFFAHAHTEDVLLG